VGDLEGAGLAHPETSLDHQRVADLPRGHHRVGGVGHQRIGAGQDSEPGIDGGDPHRSAIAVERQAIGARSDHGHALLRAARREPGIGVEEAVGRVDGDAVVLEGQRNQPIRIPVHRDVLDLHYLVARLDVDRLLVPGGGEGDGVSADPLAGARDTRAGFAATGNEDALEHGRGL
jgi:hypothetical protein